MSTSNKPYIVLIDDDTNEDHPLIDYLHMAYGAENVFLFQQPNDGIAFIEANLAKRIIVLLDIMFNNQPLGFDVFDQVVSKSTLVCFIVMTGNFEAASKEQLRNLINGHAWYLIQRDRPAKEILALIKDAEKHLMMRVDGALESWILRHSPDEQNTPFIKTRGGKSYSLADILYSIRTGENEAIGQRMAANILTMAVDLLANDKSRIGKENK
jgi:hypothetical protein